LNLELGHTDTIILPGELGLRQGVGYSTGNGANWALNTHVYQDWTLVKLGSLEFDAGVNGGASYGNTALAWTVAPEAVGRLWLLSNVNTFVRGEFPFAVSSTGCKAQNNVLLTLGLQIRFK